MLKAIEECGFVLTVEEGCLMGGFGSAVLEAANDAGLDTAHVRRLGLPDRFVLHAERDEQLAEVGLDVDGIVAAAARAGQAPRPRGEANGSARRRLSGVRTQQRAVRTGQHRPPASAKLKLRRMHRSPSRRPGKGRSA